MKKLRSCKMAALVAGVVSASLLPQMAGAVSYNCTDYIYGGVLMGISSDSSSGPLLVGEMKLVTPSPGPNSRLYTYSTDVGVPLAGIHDYTPTPFSSAHGVSPSWIDGGIQNAARLWYANRGIANNAYESAGLQLAIWQLLYNSPTTGFDASTFFNPHNGGFHITSGNDDALISANYAAGFLATFSDLPSCPDSVCSLSPTASFADQGNFMGFFFDSGITNATPDTASTFSLMGMTAVTLALGVSYRRK